MYPSALGAVIWHAGTCSSPRFPPFLESTSDLINISLEEQALRAISKFILESLFARWGFLSFLETDPQYLPVLGGETLKVWAPNVLFFLDPKLRCKSYLSKDG